MIDSLWVQWSYAVNDRLTGASVAQLCQMAAAMARALGDAGEEALGGAVAVPFEVELALEGR